MTLSGRGGKREGAGRPKGTTKGNVVFYIRCTVEEKKKLQEYIKQLRQKKDEV